MKICIIVDDYLPDSIKVGAKMMHELAVELNAQGHEVTVITPSFSNRNKFSIERLDDITILRFKSSRIKNTNKFQRTINETLLSTNAWRYGQDYYKKNSHDLIVFYSPSIFWGGLVSKLKKLWGANSYLVLRDFFPQWAVDQQLITKNSLIEKYFRHFESINYSAADTIGVMSPKNLEWFNNQHKSRFNAELLYNWSGSLPTKASSTYRKMLKLENKVVLFYGGNIGLAQDMMNIIRLAKKFQNNDKAHFILVGRGDEVELIRSTIKCDKLSNITLLDSVTQEEYIKMLTEFDIGLFSLHKNHTTHNFPGKILSYMTQSLPILGSINKGNDLKTMIDDYSAGLISTNPDDEKFYKDALKLVEDPEFRNQIGLNGHQLLMNQFSTQSAVDKILKTI